MIRAVIGAIGTFFCVHLVAAYLAWTAGWNFDGRSIDVAAGAFVVLALAGFVSMAMYTRIILLSQPVQMPASPEIEERRRDLLQLMLMEYVIACREVPDGVDWPLPPSIERPNKFLLASALEEEINRITTRILNSGSLPLSVNNHRLIVKARG